MNKNTALPQESVAMTVEFRTGAKDACGVKNTAKPQECMALTVGLRIRTVVAREPPQHVHEVFLHPGGCGQRLR